jgi:hypothetical protein
MPARNISMLARRRQVRALKGRSKLAQGKRSTTLGLDDFIFHRAGSMPARLLAADLDREIICERSKNRRGFRSLRSLHPRLYAVARSAG